MKQIINFPKYYIEEDGTIWSFQRAKPIRLKSCEDFDGYPRVVLFHNKQSSILRVHRLVAETYIPNPNNFPLVLHKVETYPMNNHVSNLWWGTHEDNTIDRQNKNRQAKGEQIKASKLTNEDVRAMRNSTKSIKELAIQYQVHQSTISRILQRKSWKHI